LGNERAGHRRPLFHAAFVVLARCFASRALRVAAAATTNASRAHGGTHTLLRSPGVPTWHGGQERRLFELPAVCPAAAPGQRRRPGRDFHRTRPRPDRRVEGTRVPIELRVGSSQCWKMWAAQGASGFGGPGRPCSSSSFWLSLPWPESLLS